MVKSGGVDWCGISICVSVRVEAIAKQQCCSFRTFSVDVDCVYKSYECVVPDCLYGRVVSSGLALVMSP